MVVILLTNTSLSSIYTNCEPNEESFIKFKKLTLSLQYMSSTSAVVSYELLIIKVVSLSSIYGIVTEFELVL